MRNNALLLSVWKKIGKFANDYGENGQWEEQKACVICIGKTIVDENICCFLRIDYRGHYKFN
jgi:hypothetical protein